MKTIIWFLEDYWKMILGWFIISLFVLGIVYAFWLGGGWAAVIAIGIIAVVAVLLIWAVDAVTS